MRSVQNVILLLLIFTTPALHAQSIRPDIPNVIYGMAGEFPLKLDIYYPTQGDPPFPVVVWIHGGGWRSGDRYNPEAAWLTTAGYAVVSVSYRLSTWAKFPAQIQDCKGAIRWIRSNAYWYRFDPSKIGVWGSSSGGHLAELLGTSDGVQSLEGSIGGNLVVSSRVQAVCSFFGHSDFLTLLEYPGAINRRKPSCTVAQLLGTMIVQDSARARWASPITYVSIDDPPFLLAHGTADRIVPYQQSVELNSALHANGVESTLRLLPGEGHGSSAFDQPNIRNMVRQFFDHTLNVGPPVVAGPLPRRLELRCSPNPASGMVTVSCSTPVEGDVGVELANALGRVVQRHSIECPAPGRYLLRLNLEDLPAGHYTVTARRGWAHDVKRVTVVH
jgi:acetyl esterase/lipase